VDISGPYLDRERWTIRWEDPATGKPRCFSRKDRALVDAKVESLLDGEAPPPARQHEGTGPAPTLDALEDFDGSPAAWKTAARDILRGAYDALVRANTRELDRWKKLAGVYQSISSGVVPHAGHEETEEALEHANETIREKRRLAVEENAPKHNEGEAAGAGVPGADRPEDPVCRPGGEIPN
jgi:hypothetical protein